MASQGNSAHGIDPKKKKRDNRFRKKKKMALAAHRPAGRKSRKSKTTRLGVPFFSVFYFTDTTICLVNLGIVGRPPLNKSLSAQ